MGKKLTFGVIFLIFLVIALLLFFISVGLGVYAAVTGSSGSPNESYYFMVAATILALIVPFPGTIGIKFLIDLLKHFGEEDLKKLLLNGEGTDGKELVQLNPADVGLPDDGKMSEHFIEAEFYDYYIRIVRGDKFQSVTCCSAILLLMGIFFLMLSYLGLLWMIVVAYDFTARTEKEVWPFIVTELVVGLICPFFLFIAVTLISIVMRFVTGDQVDPRAIISRVLPSVKLVQGETVKAPRETLKFWVISNNFYMKLRKPCGTPGELRHSIDNSISTWLLVFISGLSIILAMSYFLNQNIVTEMTIPVEDLQSNPDTCQTHSCFRETNFVYIPNCSNNTFFQGAMFLHCFRFLEFGQDTDIITSLGITIGFYLATVHYFSLIFIISNVLFHIRQTKLWSILIFLLGIGLFIGALVVLFSPHFTDIHLDIIKVGQFFLVAIYSILIGVLLCTGEVKEIVPVPIKRERLVADPKHFTEAANRQDEKDRAASLTASADPKQGITNV